MRRPLAAIVAFALGCGVITSAAAAYYLLPEPEGDLAVPATETTYPVTLVAFTDQRSLPLQPAFTRGTELTASAAGIVTGSACVPGEQLPSGHAALSINGAPVIALAADLPFYRDLGWGNDGPDVNSLRGALSAIGYDLHHAGAFDQQVYSALRDLQEARRMQHRDGGLHLDDVLWMPSDSPAIATCDIRIGQTYIPGTTLATTRSTLHSLTIMPDKTRQIVAGERSVQVFGVDVTIPESGVLTDTEALKEIGASPGAASELSAGDEDPAPISGTSELVEPLNVAAIPATAVYRIEGTRGCVAADDSARAVTIVGANLGMSLVTFDDTPPAAVHLQPDEEPCSAG